MLKFVRGLCHQLRCYRFLSLYLTYVLFALVELSSQPWIKAKMTTLLMSWICQCFDNFYIYVHQRVWSVAFIYVHILISGYGIRVSLVFKNEIGNNCSLCNLRKFEDHFKLLGINSLDLANGKHSK